ncbi:MAG: iron-sulfur cluster assembly scaffold protein [Thermodesulfobacteriota bacterium]|nr:iron-sulfur cluster assembly scaffold protein [Thermodesulfobacteriota bacterium]
MGKQEANDDISKMLSETGYSDKAIEYFLRKESIGVIEDADQVTDVTGPCGDTMKISLNIDGDKISDAKMQVLGCPGAVASGCAVANLAKGRSLEEAGQINLEELYGELEKLPEQKIHCARLAIRTLKKALEAYQQKGQTKAVSKDRGGNL